MPDLFCVLARARNALAESLAAGLEVFQSSGAAMNARSNAFGFRTIFAICCLHRMPLVAIHDCIDVLHESREWALMAGLH